MLKASLRREFVKRLRSIEDKVWGLGPGVQRQKRLRVNSPWVAAGAVKSSRGLSSRPTQNVPACPRNECFELRMPQDKFLGRGSVLDLTRRADSALGPLPPIVTSKPADHMPPVTLLGDVRDTSLCVQFGALGLSL